MKAAVEALRRFLLGSGAVKGYLEGLPSRSKAELVGMIEEYRDRLLARVSVTTVESRAKWVRLFVNWAREDVVIKGEDLKPVERFQDLPGDLDRSPTPEGLRSVLARCGLREKALFSVGALTGIRLGSLMRLRPGDLEDLNLEALDASSEVLTVRVPSQKSKGRRHYTTFIGGSARGHLLNYLKARRDGLTPHRAPEPLTAESYWFTAMLSPRALTLSPIQKMFTRLFNPKRTYGEGITSRYELHFHSPRKYFDTQVDAAGVNRVYREAMMGHRLQGTDERYSRPTDEALKTNYVIALEKLDSERLGPSTEDAEYDLALRFLEARVGADGKERFVKWTAERSMKRGKAVMRALAYAFDRQPPWNNNSAAESKSEAKPRNGSAKIVEGDDALVRAVAEGWELLKELSGGRYLVKATASGV